MPNMNQCNFCGHLGRDPEVKTLENGTVIANFTVAVGDRVKKKDEWVEETEWVRAVSFGSTAEYLAKYAKKGDLCLLTGKMKTRKWTDKDGVEKYSTEIIAERVQTYSREKRDASAAPITDHQAPLPQSPKKQAKPAGDPYEDTIPF